MTYKCAWHSILMYVYVAPPTPVGAWSMALGLRQRFEYYYKCALYHFSSRISICTDPLLTTMVSEVE